MEMLFESLFFALLATLIGFITTWIKAKTTQIKATIKDDTAKKYIDYANEIITKCVIAANQTYVNGLKAKGVFDLDAQHTAFTMVYNQVMDMLTEESKAHLIEVYGDLELYLTNQIEANVNKAK